MSRAGDANHGDLMDVPDLLDEDPLNSYRALDNLKRGLDPEEGKNTKVTLELLQQMDYEDVAANDSDDFKPDLIMNESDINDNSEEEESVFNYLFP